MSGNHSRDKGHNFERLIVKDFRDLGFEDANRNLTETQIYEQGVDLVHTGIFKVQCKKYKKYVNPNKIEEIKDKTGFPLLITAGDRKEPVACMYWKDLIKIISVYLDD